MDIVWKLCADIVYRLWKDCGDSVGRVVFERMFKGVGECGESVDIVWRECGDIV